MKVRNGFVSNSSSSSFIVIMKNGKEMTKSNLLEIFDVKKTSPLYSFSNDLSEWIVKNIKECDIDDIYSNYCGHDKNLTVDQKIEAIIKDYYGITKDVLIKIKNGEYKYYEGSAYDDSGYGLETYLCESEINIENDIISIKGGGSY